MNTTSELIDRPAVADTAAPESTQASEAPRRGPAVTPAVDIVEDSEGITLWADLPGVSKAGLDLRVHDNRLTIDAQVSLPLTEGLRACSTPNGARRAICAASWSARTSIPRASRRTCATAC